MTKKLSVSEVCFKLQYLQRDRREAIALRIMYTNGLQMRVAGRLGYDTNKERERKEVYMLAGNILSAVNDTSRQAHGLREDDQLPLEATLEELRLKNQTPAMLKRIKTIEERLSASRELVKKHVSGMTSAMIQAGLLSINQMDKLREFAELEMLDLVKHLPALSWVEADAQNGFGALSLATVIGETGDLANYATPAKLWRRLGCAPWEYNGQKLMGSTWRRGKEGKLTSEEWEKYGYNPRRRSIAYLIGENLVRGNFLGGDGGYLIETDLTDADPPRKKPGPYRLRYELARLKAAKRHPEWLVCGVCDGTKKVSNRKACPNCKGTGEVKKRLQLHGMLLATKLFLRELWKAWNPKKVKSEAELRRERGKP